MKVNDQLIRPNSIVVIGGSNDLSKPGGKLLNNLLENHFQGELFVVNKMSKSVQGLIAYSTEAALPKNIDLAILVIPAIHCLQSVRELAERKNTKAFIIVSAGFGELGTEGMKIEKEIVEVIEKNGACLIGPNSIGVLNTNYCGVFTSPIPELSSKGCDLISSSGATAVFLMEAGMPLGVKFSSVFSLGNSAMVGVEDILEYMDVNFDSRKDAKVKLLYLEQISDPKRFLKYSRSLLQKGAKIAAIKAGSSETGGKAAASHTGAISSSDEAIRALFRKAGIIYCSSRTELLSIASLFHYGDLKGDNFAIITHAGGSAVMLTDTLSNGGLNVPEIKGPESEKLLSYLNKGSSVSNPIDFLATGTAEQLGIIIDYCENVFQEIDAMIVVFGSPGLFNVQAAYNVLSVKLEICKKPIYPVLPSIVNAKNEISRFLQGGNINFPDEVELGNALVAVHNQKMHSISEHNPLNNDRISKMIAKSPNGFLPTSKCNEILKEIDISVVNEWVFHSKDELLQAPNDVTFPCAVKVLGPIHKTDSGGVILNVYQVEDLLKAYDTLMTIKAATGIVVQPMLQGHELFIGAKREDPFGHLIFCGFGGIYIELIQDFVSELAPVSRKEATTMIERLRAYPILSGYRGMKGIDLDLYSKYIERISDLVSEYPQISEIDINPLIVSENLMQAVDVRIKIQGIDE